MILTRGIAKIDLFNTFDMDAGLHQGAPPSPFDSDHHPR
nr:hypothetical protein [Rhizobium ruizarguesonis]